MQGGRLHHTGSDVFVADGFDRVFGTFVDRCRDGLHDLFGVGFGGGDAGDADGCDVPDVVVGDLCHCDVEVSSEAFDEWADDVALFFEGPASFDSEVDF